MILKSRTPVFGMALISSLIAASGCGLGESASSESASAEVAQAAGDVMASLDESSADTGGSFAFYIKASAVDRYFASWSDRVVDALLPSVWADPCHLVGFTYAHPVATREFGGCNRGRGILEGNVTLTFSEADDDFKLEEVGDSVIRVPEFTITGSRNGVLSVSGANGGQKLTLSQAGESKTFLWTTLGMSRTLVRDGETIFDIQTRTLEDITVTGTSRRDRVMNGGSIEVTNSVEGSVSVLTHNNLTWDSSCTCAVSGSLSGTKTVDGVSSDLVIEMTGCGTATVTTDGVAESVTFDRCSEV